MEKLLSSDEKLENMIKQNNEDVNIETCCIIKREDLSKSVNEVGDTFLHLASKYHNVVVIQFLIDLAYNVNAQNFAGQTPIILAIENATQNSLEDQVPSIEILFAAKANIYITDNSGVSAAQIVFDSEIFCGHDITHMFLNLIQQECMGNSELIAQKLLSVKFPLAMAALTENCEIIEHMIKKGYPVNASSVNLGFTALHGAVEVKDLKTVEILVKYGADPNMVDCKRNIPLAYYGENLSSPSDIQYPKNVKVLIEKLVIPDDVDDEGIFLANQISRLFRYGNKEVLKILLGKEFDLIAIKDEYNRTALHQLATNFHSDIMEPLKRKNYNLNVRDSDGNTPLHCAIQSYWTPLNTLKYLLDNGIDVNVQNNDQCVPLFLLCQNKSMSKKKYCKLVQLFLQYGLDIQYCGLNQVTVFDILMENLLFSRAKPLLAHLAILQEEEKLLAEHIRNKIDSHDMYKNYFRLCSRKRKKMKNNSVDKELTLYRLLVDEEEQIIRKYKFDETVLFKLSKLAKRCRSNYHYYGIVQKRMSSIVIKIESIQKSARLICKFLNILYDPHHLVVTEILNYLDYQDLKVLATVT